MHLKDNMGKMNSEMLSKNNSLMRERTFIVISSDSDRECHLYSDNISNSSDGELAPGAGSLKKLPKPFSQMDLVKVNGVCLTHTQLTDELLAPGAWLTDEIINAFTYQISKCTQNIPSSEDKTYSFHCTSTFFYSSITSTHKESRKDSKWIQRWQENCNYHNRKFIFIPINWGNSHWALLVVRPSDRLISYYDSMMCTRNGKRALSTLKLALENTLTAPNFNTNYDCDAISYSSSSTSSTDRYHRSSQASCGKYPILHGAMAFLMTRFSAVKISDDNVTNSSGESMANDNSNQGLQKNTLHQINGSNQNKKTDPIQEELCDKSIPIRYKTEIPPDQPQQSDGSSCGLFVCWWISRISGFIKPNQHSRLDSQSFRRFIYDTIRS